jgi:membrane protease YdiL (CAAX protease family)
MNQTELSKQIRLWELCLVLSVAILPLMVMSVYGLRSDDEPMTQPMSHIDYVYSIITELTSIALLVYVLYRQRRRLFDIGLSFRVKDVGISIVLAAAGLAAYYAVYYMVAAAWSGLGHPLEAPQGFSCHGNRISVIIVFFLLLNPIFEELIVRAFTMSEVEYLTRSMAKAVVLSVAIQTIYHLYQGVPSALSLSGIFLVFSLYYAKYRRILPVILAHCYFDLSLLFYTW